MAEIIQVSSPSPAQVFTHPVQIISISPPKSIEIGVPSNPLISIQPVANLKLIDVGKQGPSGIDGAPGNSISKVAGSALSAKKMVFLDNDDGKIYLASNSSAEASYALLGMTQSAVSSGASATIVTGGEITNDTWSWDINADSPLYLSANGEITQTPPSSGYLISVGFVVSSTKIFIRITQPINLT